MAIKNLDSKFELIQNTISNPEFKSKLGNIINEMTPSELAYVIESSPHKKEKLFGILSSLILKVKYLVSLMKIFVKIF